MLIKNKNFSYPLLNRFKENSTYKTDYIFEFKYDFGENEEEILLNNCKCETNSDFLKKLAKDGDIKLVCVIECSSCIYRESYELSFDNPITIQIKKSLLNDQVYISCYAYATKDIKICSEEFIDEYIGEFDIDKHDIIAADDGLSFVIRREDKDLNLTHSIFSIIPDHNSTTEGYNVVTENKRIVISLDDENYKNYKAIYNVENYKEIFFSMILVHALEIGLSEAIKFLNEPDKDMDDAINKYRWLSSVSKAYKINNGKELTKEIMLEYSNGKACLLSQNLMANPIKRSLKIMKDNLNKPEEEYEG